MTRLALLLPLVGLGFVVDRPQGDAPDDPATPPPAAAKTASPDEAAIGALLAEFVRAYNAGDAPALAALFTDDAQIKAEGGRTVTGRAAIEERFAALFESAPGQTLAVQTESLRMLGPGAAIEEGTAVVTAPGDDEAEAEASRSRYVATYVKIGGKWLQNDIHDFPVTDEDNAASAHDHLKDLEWLRGEWLDEDDEGEVHTTCDWSDDGSFLLRRFKLRVEGEFVMSGVQRIGWDPRLKQFRSWVFDSEGGFSDGLWARAGDRWLIKTTGVLKDGRSASATNIFTRDGNDVIRWVATNRVVGGRALPDADEVILVRKPPEPGPPPAEGPQSKETPR